MARWPTPLLPALAAVQTFAGITNENECYSHHYLTEVFNGDIENRLQAWAQRWFTLRIKSGSKPYQSSASRYKKDSDNDCKNRISRAQKEAIRQQGLLNEDGDLATPFRRLKLVMDYWCALWLWPISRSADLPSREQWWMEVGETQGGPVTEFFRGW